MAGREERDSQRRGEGWWRGDLLAESKVRLGRRRLRLRSKLSERRRGDRGFRLGCRVGVEATEASDTGTAAVRLKHGRRGETVRRCWPAPLWRGHGCVATAIW
jgi:hypothetical protein